jgi:hypothetical protein
MLIVIAARLPYGVDADHNRARADSDGECATGTVEDFPRSQERPQQRPEGQPG